MSILTDSDISSIISVIAEIVGDDVIGTTIIIKQSGDTVSAWSPTSQLIPAMWTESSVSAFKGSYTLKEIKESGGMIQFGDCKFIFTVSATTGILSTDDMIYVASSSRQLGTTYQVVDIVRDPLNIAFFIQGRNV
jgi:hypothetical protein